MSTDFWFNVLWTVLVAAATLFADWLAARLILLTRGFAAIVKVVERAAAGQATIQDVRAEVQKIQIRKAASATFGADLVVVALALDFSILGMWIAKAELFPFFQRWDVGGVKRDLAVWLLLFAVHFLLLLASLVLKHFHSESVEGVPVPATPFITIAWWKTNWCSLAANVVGVFALFSALSISTNAF